MILDCLSCFLFAAVLYGVISTKNKGVLEIWILLRMLLWAIEYLYYKSITPDCTEEDKTPIAYGLNSKHVSSTFFFCSVLFMISRISCLVIGIFYFDTIKEKTKNEISNSFFIICCIFMTIDMLIVSTFFIGGAIAAVLYESRCLETQENRSS